MPESQAHQAQESTRPLNVPVGMIGVAGCPEQKAPEQGRGGWGMGLPPDRPARSTVRRSISAGRRPGLEREVTRWLQPARAEPGAQKPWNTSSTTAPVPIHASRLKCAFLIKTLPPIGKSACSRELTSKSLSVKCVCNSKRECARQRQNQYTHLSSVVSRRSTKKNRRIANSTVEAEAPMHRVFAWSKLRARAWNSHSGPPARPCSATTTMASSTCTYPVTAGGPTTAITPSAAIP
jgi:hypothetical protein